MNARALASAVALVTAAVAPVARATEPAGQARAGADDCVTIARPRPSTVYTYELVDARGVRTRTTQQWETVTDTGFRLRTTGQGGNVVIVNEHRIVDDVAVLDRTSKLGPGGATIEATSFSPGLVSDPAFRACAGRTWQIPSVTASFQSNQIKHSAGTPAGSLRIVAIRERITVPAGTFETVHYIRTSQSTDEYWKSLEHGVVVKHTGTVGANVITETLVSIK